MTTPQLDRVRVRLMRWVSQKISGVSSPHNVNCKTVMTSSCYANPCGSRGSVALTNCNYYDEVPECNDETYFDPGALP